MVGAKAGRGVGSFGRRSCLRNGGIVGVVFCPGGLGGGFGGGVLPGGLGGARGVFVVGAVE